MRASLISGLLLFALQGSPIRAQQPAGTPVLEASQLIGSWEGTDATGEKGTLQFQPGGFVQMTMHGQQLAPPPSPTGRPSASKSTRPRRPCGWILWPGTARGRNWGASS